MKIDPVTCMFLSVIEHNYQYNNMHGDKGHMMEEGMVWVDVLYSNQK